MRKILTFAAVLALAGCGGGGGAAAAPRRRRRARSRRNADRAAEQLRPAAVLHQSSAAHERESRARRSTSASTIQSIKIALTADSNGVPVGTIGGNPAETDINFASCGGGCVVNGPPSPPGTDSFTVVTYDATGAAGNALNAGQLNNVAITAGQSNPETITLGAIPASLAISNVPYGVGSLAAGTTGQTTAISVIAKDADGNTIPTGQSPAVYYVDATGAAINVTVSRSGHERARLVRHRQRYVDVHERRRNVGHVLGSGHHEATRVRRSRGEPGNAHRLREHGATSGTAVFEPVLNAPVFNGTPATPSGVAENGSPEIDLFATTLVGSTGTEYFTESGWTNSPYNQRSHVREHRVVHERFWNHRDVDGRHRDDHRRQQQHDQRHADHRHGCGIAEGRLVPVDDQRRPVIEHDGRIGVADRHVHDVVGHRQLQGPPTSRPLPRRRSRSRGCGGSQPPRPAAAGCDFRTRVSFSLRRLRNGVHDSPR